VRRQTDMKLRGTANTSESENERVFIYGQLSPRNAAGDQQSAGLTNLRPASVFEHIYLPYITKKEG